VSISLIIFVVAFTAGLGLALFRHPVYGLYTYVAIFYVHPPSRWWAESLPDLRWSLLSAAVTLLAVLIHNPNPGRPSWLSTAPGKILLVFAIWLWIQMAWALDVDEQRTAAVLFTKYVILFFLVYRLIDTPAEVRRFLMVHVAGCFYLGWLAYGVDVSGRLEGVGGPGIDEANALAAQLATGVAAAAMFILVERRYVQWLCVLSTAFTLNGVVVAGSRSAFIALLFGGLALWYFKPKAHRGLFYLFATLALTLFAMVAHETFWERMSTITTAVEDRENADISAQSRLALIDAQWRMAAEYPFGAGHRGTAVLSPQFLEEQYLAAPDNPGEIAQRSSHNTFMTALVEQGIPGAIMFLLIWAWAARASLFVKRTIVGEPPSTHAWTAAIAATLLIVLVGGMFVDYIKSEVQVWMLALLASMVTYAKQLSAKPAFAGIGTSGEIPAKAAGRVTGPSPSLRPRS